MLRLDTVHTNWGEDVEKLERCVAKTGDGVWNILVSIPFGAKKLTMSVCMCVCVHVCVL